MGSALSIAIVVPPGQGGVRDYSDLLATKSAGPGRIEVMTVSARDPDIAWQRAAEAACVYVQYSGYGYAARGAPLWLVRALQRHRSRIAQLGVYFHELYACGPPWSSAFWFAPAQRQVARRLLELSDFWVTNRAEAADWLQRAAVGQPHRTLPVISNIGETPAWSRWRRPKVVVFGGAGRREKAYRAAGERFFHWARRLGLEVHDIGAPIPDGGIDTLLARHDVIRHGRTDTARVAEMLVDASFGLLAIPTEHAAKSGVLAAYCAHGIAPILASRQYAASDGLVAGKHYLPVASVDAPGRPDHAAIGRAAWHWYQGHRLSVHLEALRNLATSAAPGASQ